MPDTSGGTERRPFQISDFLGSSYYVLSIVIVLLGVVSFMLSAKWRVDGLEQREREHPTKQELAEVAIKVDDKIKSLETHVDNIDRYGTRALSDRTTQIELTNRAQEDRLQDFTRRLNEIQTGINKTANEIPVIIDRQNSNTNAVQELQRMLFGSGRSPIGPIGPGYNNPTGTTIRGK